MNKMMLAAALALTVGAYAKANTCGDYTPEYACALWYDVTIKVKTTGAKFKTVKTCDDPDDICYRVTTSKTFKGIYVTCDCDCESFIGASLYLWNTKEKLIYAFNEATEMKMWRIGSPKMKKDEAGTEVEAEWISAGYFAFTAQGFGKGTILSDYEFRVKKISGGLVGVLPGPVCYPKCKDEALAIIWDCGGTPGEEEATVAFGTWNMKLNAAKSKELAVKPVVKLPIGFSGTVEGVDLGDGA